MNTRSSFSVAAICILSIVFFACGCGGGSSPAVKAASDPAAQNGGKPALQISALTPSKALTGTPGFVLTVSGTGFQTTSTVQWNGISRVTTYVSATQLTASILAVDLLAAGTPQVTVLNPDPNGGVSNPVTFTVNNSPPVLTSLSITSMYAGSPLTDIMVYGTGFFDGAQVLWDGKLGSSVPYEQGGTTKFVNGTTLQYTTALVFTGQPGSGQITAANPLSEPSNSLTMTLNASGPGLAQSFVSDAWGGPFTISPDNRYVTFSAPTQLDPSLYNAGCPSYGGLVYARDSCTGAGAGCTPATLTLPGVCSNYDKGYSSDNLRYAAITDFSPPYASTSGKVELWDTCLNGPNGCARSAVDVSVRADGTVGTFPPSKAAAISATGRYVLFWSQDLNIDATASPGLFLRDTCIGAAPGCVPSTQRISVDSGGTALGTPAEQANMTPDGRFVAFSAPPVPGQLFQAFVRDTCLGVLGACVPSTTLVSVDNGGTVANWDSRAGGLSADGRYVTFSSRGTNLAAGDTNNAYDAFMRDTCAGALGACVPSTLLISDAGGVPGNGQSAAPMVDASGRYVVFTSLATNLDPLSVDTNKASDVLIRDTCLGAVGACTPRTRRLSVNVNGAQADLDSDAPLISRDGKVIVFYSQALNLLGVTQPYAADWRATFNIHAIYAVPSPF